MDPLLQILSIVVVFLSLTFVYTNTNQGSNGDKDREVPQPGRAWPIIGHLHLLAKGDGILYRTLGAMADKLGPTFSLRIGTHNFVVVNTWEVAKECLTVNDMKLASRPIVAAGVHMGYDMAVFGLAPYSPFWREMRKISKLELLSNRRLELLKHIRISEIDTGIKELYQTYVKNNHKAIKVDLKLWLDVITLNVAVRMVSGKRYYNEGSAIEDSEAKGFQKAIDEFFGLLGVFVISDIFPFLWWFDFKGRVKAMKRTFKELDSIFDGWLKERRRRRTEGEVKPENEQDFIDVMLSLEEEGHLSNFQHSSDTAIKSTCLALIVGGSESSSVTITWAISLLLNNRQALKKAQEEIDLHVGKDRTLEEPDIKNLVYLQAIFKETLRLYPAGPLLSPHLAMEDCTVSGYKVKVGTRVIINGWKLQRDPRVWENPTAFMPERFTTDHVEVDVRGQSYELLPFGSGRRSCPGINFAMQILHLTLARLLHAFDLDTPLGLPMDMTEIAGLTLPKATPLEVILTPRLSAKLYGY